MNRLESRIFYFFVALIIFLAAPLNCSAESAIQCHCFIDRSYNPADRFAADDYLLATSFNSFLAKVNGIPKRQIVLIKMNEGVEQDELLISLKLAKMTGISLRKFIGLRREKRTWAAIVSDLSQPGGIKKDKIVQAIGSGMPAKEAAVLIVDEMISEFYHVEVEEIKKLRLAGLGEKEITLVSILSATRGPKPETLAKQYKDEGRSWSEIAFNLGLEPDAVGRLITAYPVSKAPE